MRAPRLLLVTQKIHQNDDDLAFVILWVREFIRAGFDVEVICLEKRDFDGSFPVHSLGKELGIGKFRRSLRFLRLIWSLDYDRVFIHMNPEYITLGALTWLLRRKQVYLWFTHYTMTVHLFLAGFICKRMFAATPQSLPQYEGNPKKVVLGHGIDVDFWLSGSDESTQKLPDTEMLMVHRLSRSKRVEIGIQSLSHLPQGYSLKIFGRPIDSAYYEELQRVVRDGNLGGRVTFAGPVPMSELKSVYPQYRLMVNMASETIDKTMVESMLFGVYPVTTKGNSIAIGLPVYPQDDKPETVARFIEGREWAQYDTQHLRNIVREKHGLPALVSNMTRYIRDGN